MVLFQQVLEVMMKKNINNKLMRYIYYLIVLSIIFGCKNFEKKGSTKFLEFYYIGPGTNTTYSYQCGMLSKEVIKDINYKKNTDEKVFNYFIKLYNGYKTIKDSTGIDTRIKVIIHDNKKTDVLCLGEHFNTYKNGVKVNDNKELLEYIKKVIDYENTLPEIVRKNPGRYMNNK